MALKWKKVRRGAIDLRTLKKKKHTEEDYILIKYIFEMHLFDLNQWHLFPVGWNINIMVFKPDVTNYEWFWLTSYEHVKNNTV